MTYLPEQRELLLALLGVSEGIRWEDPLFFHAAITNLADNIELIKKADEAYLFADPLLGGKSLTVGTCRLEDNLSQKFEYSLQLPQPTVECAIVKDLDGLLRLPSFLTACPDYYYSIADSSDVLPPAYLDATRFANFLLKIADHTEELSGKKKGVFYHGTKTEIVITYSQKDLNVLPELAKLVEEFEQAPRFLEKTKILKELIIKYALTKSPDGAFGSLLSRFSELKKDFDQSWVLFVEDFSLDEIFNELESKTLSIADKLAVSLSELQKTMITIPLAILFVSSQVDAVGISSWKNILILAGCWVFHLFTLAFFWGHKRSLRFIEEELAALRQEVDKNYPQISERVNPKFTRLRRRCDYQANYRRIVGSLMWAVVLSLTLLVTGLDFWLEIIARCGSFFASF